MTESRDYLGETLRLVERAREDVYFRQLDQELINQMRQKDAASAAEAEPRRQIFTPILIPVDFSSHATAALECAADIAERFGSSLIVLHILAREFMAYATQQRLRSLSGTATTSGAVEGEREAAEAVITDQREPVYKALAEFLPPRLARYPVELRVVVGQPFERRGCVIGVDAMGDEPSQLLEIYQVLNTCDTSPSWVLHASAVAAECAGDGIEDRRLGARDTAPQTEHLGESTP